MKGLVLAGGAGTRLRPLTHTSAKQLVPVANKPILFYGIEQMAAAGITEIGLVVGDTRPEIEAVVGDGAALGVRITYIPQDAPRGLAHCVEVAAEFLGDDPFVMYLGDNVVDGDLARFVASFEHERATGRAPVAQLLLARVEEPRHFGVADLDDTGRLVRLVEKPTSPPSDLALVGVYLFSPAIHAAVRAIRPSARGELEITDAIQWLLDRGEEVRYEILESWWIDTGKKDPLLACNRLVLAGLEGRLDGEVDAESVLEGAVVVEAGARVEHSTIRGPVVVGAGTRILGSRIGPFASIGAGCTVVDAEIAHSVVLEDCRIEGVRRIEDSLIGREVELVRSDGKATRLTLGDHSRVELE